MRCKLLIGVVGERWYTYEKTVHFIISVKLWEALLFPFFILTPQIIVNGFPKEGKVIICSNHISLKDPPMLALDTKRQIFYMAKSELFENKFVGSLITALGAFSVDRGVGDSNALDRCGEILEQDGAVGIFIEGTLL